MISSATQNDWDCMIDEARSTMMGLSTATECREHVRSTLIDESRLLDRNAQISGSYAAMYLRHPSLLKWSGMAAFASHHVRKLIAIRQYAKGGSTSAQRAQRMLSEKEIETIRTINNTIHDDIFWAHIIYNGTPEGLTHLNKIVRGTKHEPMGHGFSLIEQGRLAQVAGSFDATNLIWQGNLSLLRHEQEHIVQPLLSGLSCTFARVLSLGSSLNYEPRGVVDCMKYCSSFYLFMLTREPSRLIQDRTLPRLDRLEQRWAWIQRVLVPKFQSLERDLACSKLLTIAQGCAPLGTDDRSNRQA